MWRLARLKRMIGCRDMVISSLGVVWCSNTKYSMWRLARLKRMIGCRDMVISSLGVVWCSNTKFTLGLHEPV